MQSPLLRTAGRRPRDEGIRRTILGVHTGQDDTEREDTPVTKRVESTTVSLGQ